MSHRNGRFHSPAEIFGGLAPALMAAVLVLGLTLTPPATPTASAQVGAIIVNSEEDSDDGACSQSPGDCTLREAILLARSDGLATTIGFSGDFTITVRCGETGPALPLLSGSEGDVVDGTGRAIRIFSGDACDERVVFDEEPLFGLDVSGSNWQSRGLQIGGNGNEFLVGVKLGGSNNLLSNGTNNTTPCVVVDAAEPGVLIDGTNNTVSNCFIGVRADLSKAGNGSSGVRIDGGNTAKVQNNTIGDNGIHGIEVNDGSGHDLNGNAIGTDFSNVANLGQGENGVQVNGTSGAITVRFNRVRNNDDDGINVKDAGGRVSILDNGVSANGSDGVELDGGTENLVHDNNVAGNSENGVLVDFSNAASNDIARNDISGHVNQQGIWVRGGSGTFIGSNDISGNKNGVRVETATGQPTTFGRAGQFVPNTIENNVDDGVQVSADAAVRIGGDSTNDGVPDNRIRNNGGEGIDIQSATDGLVTIFNNVIADIGSGGIRVAGTATTPRVEIGGGSSARRNLVQNNTPNNIEVDGAARALIGFNELEGANANGTSTGPNIRIFSTGEVNVVDNLIHDAAGAGVEISNNASRTEITRNTIFGHGGLGIDLGGDGVSCGNGDGEAPSENGGVRCPVITSISGSPAVVQLTYDASGCDPSRIDVYGAFQESDLHGEGGNFLGTTNGSGGSATFTCTNCSLTPSDFLTATATDTNDNRTSEFSKNRQVGTNGGPGGAGCPDGIIGGNGNNKFGGQGSGKGGSAKVKLSKQVSATAQVALRVCNDGDETDSFEVSWTGPGALDIAIGVDSSSPTTVSPVPGGICKDQVINIDASLADPRKKAFVVIFDLKSTNPNQSVFDSVRLAIKVKK